MSQVIIRAMYSFNLCLENGFHQARPARWHYLYKKLCLQSLQFTLSCVFSYRMSTKIFLFYKLFFTNLTLIKKFLEFLQPQKQPPEVFHKKTFLKNFVIFTGKHLCWGLPFIKVADLQAPVLKKSFQHRYFLVYIRKFIRTHILKNNCE